MYIDRVGRTPAVKGLRGILDSSREARTFSPTYYSKIQTVEQASLSIRFFDPTRKGACFEDAVGKRGLKV
jgi:hypothetical protein